jgi:ADP-L-glycero-D-manno-heptose 6-epimerase
MYIVTGGAGLIGSAFIWKLNEMGVEDILVVDDLGHGDKWKNLVNRRYRDYLHKNDFLGRVLSGEFHEEVEAVIHMGACSSTTETDAGYLMENNYRYSRHLCTFALERGARFIHASSAATYGDGSLGFSDDESLLPRLRPLNMYAYSKQLFDLWAGQEGLRDKFATLKFFNVFGPNEYHKEFMRSVVCKAFAEIRETGRLKLFKSHRPDYAHGEQTRDFVYVKDCVEVIWRLLENPNVNGVFNLGTGRARSWNDLAAAVFKAMKLPMAVDYVDMPEELRDKYQYHTQAAMEKLGRAGIDIGFTPLEEAVADYVGNYLDQSDPYL